MEYMDPVLEILDKYRCHLKRNNIPMLEFLKMNYENYIKDVKYAISKPSLNIIMGDEICDMISNELNNIEHTCESILTIIKMSNEKKYVESQKLSFELFNTLEEYLMYHYADDIEDNNYYRIRRVKNESSALKFDRKDIFHIPNNKSKSKKSNARYSFCDEPCLYLGSQISLCWEECGRPEKFIISQFKFSNEKINDYKMIDFSRKLMPLMFAFKCWMLNAENKDKDVIRKYFMKYICTYPLRAACSVQKEESNKGYNDEYILPQLLLQWISTKNNFLGIKYESCICSDDVHVLGGHNLVIPTTSYDIEGYDIKLRNILKISKPVYVDTTKSIYTELLNIDIDDNFERI